MQINGTETQIKHLQAEEVMQSLRRIVKALHEYSTSVEKRFGLTGPQLWALWELSRAGTLSLKELSARMHLDPSTVTGVVDRLQKRGLLVRATDPEDRRRVVLSLTAEGAQLLKGAPHPAQGQLLHALHAMDLERVKGLNETLKQLAADMEVDSMDVRFFFAED
jgi:DNA-binding MarR family transcriptional regulator